MKVEIWSDVVCPFCYIGKRKFEKALAQFEHRNEVEVIWHSYQLNPDAKYVPGQTIHQLLAKKKGLTEEYAKELHIHMTKTAAEVGLEYNFDKVMPANTFDAHRLIHLAAKHGLQDKMKERLLLAYFTQGMNVSDHLVLVELGNEIGLDKGEVKAMLESNAMAAEVNADIQEARTFGIPGVPFFVFNRKYAVSGAKPPEEFLSALKTAWADWKKENPFVTVASSEGDSCEPGKPC